MGMDKIFYYLGLKVATHPILVSSVTLMLLAIILPGLVFLDFELEPQKLWVSQTSKTNHQQLFFAKKFGAYYRINQIIIRKKDENDSSDVFTKENLRHLFKLQKNITEGQITFLDKNYTVDDFCYKPIEGKGCMITSPTNFWLENEEKMEKDDIKEKAKCLESGESGEMPCFDSLGTPIQLSAIFGMQGCEEPDKTLGECTICRRTARSMSITFMLQNDFYTNEQAAKWENDVFKESILAFNKDEERQNDGLVAEYMMERSVSDELELESSQNMLIVIISYLVMFIYISVMMGGFDCLIQTKIIVGLGGIIVVALSCLGSFAIVSLFGVKQSLISAEVVPFLVLAIGADNMFIITTARDRRAHKKVLKSQQSIEDKKTDEEQVAHAMKEVGPSITTAAFGEFLSFLVGYFTDIPALESFCLCASLAILINYLLQMTLFVSLVILDDKRIAHRRYDLIPFIKIPEGKEVNHYEGKIKIQDFAVKTWYKWTRSFVFQIIVGIVYLIITGVSFYALVAFPRGLNQQTTVTSDGDLIKYFKSQEKYVDIGSPAYIVFYNIDYNNETNLQLIDTISDEVSSLSTVLPPVYSWYKDFQKFMSSYYQQKCNPNRDALLTQPLASQVKEFLKIRTDDRCCKEDAICGEPYINDIAFNDNGDIEASRFRFMHIALTNQSIYVGAVEQTNAVTRLHTNDFKLMEGKNTTSNFVLNGEKVDISTVFPYSLFYVYYDQYLFIRGITVQNLLIGFAIVFFAVQIVMNILGALTAVLFVFSCVLHLIGILWILNSLPDYKVELNAVSAVNIVVALGLSVEFCCHIIIFYLRSNKSEKVERISFALHDVGASVFIGIILTKFIGVSVLLFAPSKIFQVYYFRMYIALVVVGFYHGFILLPIYLTYVNIGQNNKSDMESIYEEEINKIGTTGGGEMEKVSPLLD